VNYLIRKIVKVSGESQGHQDHEVDTERLSIGRGTDQDLLLPGDRVAYSHAEITRVGGQMELRSLAATGVTVNGRTSKVALLTVGDQILIGGYRLVVIEPPHDNVDFALTVEQLQQPDMAALDESLFRTRLRRLRWMSPRGWAWIGFILMLLLGLALPAMVAWTPDDRESVRAQPAPDDHFWLSGDLSQGHAFIGDQCENCHKAPFERVPNSACMECHDDMGRHVDLADQSRDVVGSRCASCHREHNGSQGVIIRDQKFCTSCHSDISEVAGANVGLQDVSDFSAHHPEFRVTLLLPSQRGDGTVWHRTDRLEVNDALREDSQLLFDHQVHLSEEGVENELGEQETMVCSDCHQQSGDGLGMEPIRMEAHCSRCHSLAFDPDIPSRTVPHGEPEAVIGDLREFFSRRFIEMQDMQEQSLARPGMSSAELSDLQREGLAWVENRTAVAARDLFERRVCTTCHTINRLEGPQGVRWRVAPVRINQNYWFDSARFSHAKHDSMECVDCHDAPQSQKASDVLMPDIAECRQCHVGERGGDGLESTCITCHRFHYPEHGKLGAP
jgi:predicted CXXCH cytochrome family protein